MRLIDLLDRLAALDVQLWADGERLRCRGPVGALTADLRGELEAHKPEILASLRSAAEGRQLPPLTRIDRQTTLPLSFAQQRLWFLAQLEPDSTAYNIPAALEITGDLDVAVLTRAANEIVRRHEVLRTTFADEGGQAALVIHPALTLTIPQIDLADRSDDERRRELAQLALRQLQEQFDLARGPLLRVRLVRMDGRRHVLLFTIHHIVSDGWSSRVFMRELALLYEAFAAGRSSPLGELPIQYVDFAHWQQQWLRGAALERQLDYWRSRLAGLRTVDLPFDRPRPPVQTFGGASQTFALPADLSDALKAFSRDEGVTLFMLLLAAFNVLVYHYTGESDLAIGSPVVNRGRPELEPLIGFFVNAVIFRTDLSGNPTVRELLARVRERSLEAYAHQDLPFEQVVAELQPRRDLSRHPLFQVVFVLQDNPVERQEIAGLSLRQLEIESANVKFDLVVNVWSAQESLVVWWEYNSDLFDRATIAQMSADFETLLRDIVARSEAQIDDVQVLSQREQLALSTETSITELTRDFAF